ncbi:MAG TPA: hypothetical protein VEB86_09240 [Chryseosolibacter sp.]|nr:hypothetical protein [Chryseosolibacter sp.]
MVRFNRKNWKAVALCVFAATVFWFLNALNKTYTTNLRFPLTFEYDRQNFVPVKSLPKEIRVNVTGNGWNLFRRSTGVKIPPLEIPVERPLETRKIVASTLPAYFSNQLEGLEINYVLTDTLYVSLEPKTVRWIKLALDTTSLRMKKGYGLASFVSIMPDSIFVEGPRPIIDQIQEPVRIQLPFGNIDEHFMEDVEVQLPSSDLLKRNPPTVAVMFDVEKMVTIEDSARLVILNLPANVWPVIGRRKVPIKLSIPQNMMGEFNRDSLRATLDLKRIPRGEKALKPAVSGLPPYATVIHVDSVKVKF